VNGVVTLTDPISETVVGRYVATTGATRWRLGVPDNRNAGVRALEILVEPHLHGAYIAEARRLSAAAAGAVAGLDPADRAATVRAFEANAGAVTSLIGALDRAHVITPIELVVVGDERQATTRTAVAWARSRGVPSVHLAGSVPLGARESAPMSVDADRAIGFGERGRRWFLAAGVPAERIRTRANPGFLTLAQLARTRETVRSAVRAECRWPGDAEVVVLALHDDALRTAALEAAGGLRARRPNARFALIDVPAGQAEQQALAQLALRCGLTSTDVVLVTGDGDRVIAAADVVISADSVRSFQAQICGAVTVNVWTQASWLGGPAFAATDGICEVRPRDLGPTLDALLGAPDLRGALVANGLLALAAIGGVPDEGSIDAIVGDLLAERRVPTPIVVREPRPDILMYIGDYRHTSAGVRVVHRLAHLVNLVGGDATVFARQTHPLWSTPRRTWRITDRTIVVYPEVQSGNPMAAKRVVRYVLNVPGKIAGDTRYADGEMVFYYADAFLAGAQAATSELLTPDRLLSISVLEPDLFFNDRSLERSYDCVYLGKGEHIYERGIRPPQIAAAFVIRRDERNPWPATREETATLLRGCRRLYTYDRHTAAILEGLACGVQIFFINEDGSVEPYETEPVDYAAWYYDLTHVERFYRLVRERYPE